MRGALTEGERERGGAITTYHMLIIGIYTFPEGRKEKANDKTNGLIVVFHMNVLNRSRTYSIFSVADTQLYKRLCPSVGPSFGPPVGPSVREHELKTQENHPKC